MTTTPRAVAVPPYADARPFSEMRGPSREPETFTLRASYPAARTCGPLNAKVPVIRSATRAVEGDDFIDTSSFA